MHKSTLLVLPAVLAANIEVKVGDGGLVFNPNKVTANVGDTLSFKWSSPYHSVSQSTFDSPCMYKDGGINSGVVMTTTGQDFVVTVKDTNPIWIYCDVAQHCQQGMVLAVNPPSGMTIDDFKSNAAGASSGSPPTAVSGGSFGSSGSGSSGSSSMASSSSMMASSSSMAAGSTMSSTMSSSMATMSSGTASSAASTTLANGMTTNSVGSQTSSAATSATSKAAAGHHAGDAVAVVGAAALALFL